MAVRPRDPALMLSAASVLRRYYAVSLVEAGFARTKDHLFSRISQLSSLGFMTTAVIGAYVASIDIAWPWLLGGAGFAVSGFMGAFLRERVMGGAHLQLVDVPVAIAHRISQGIRRGFALRSVRLLSVAEGIVLAAMAPYWLEWPLLFGDSVGVGVWVVGWIFCLLSLAHTLGAEIVVRTGALSARRPTALAFLTLGAGLLLTAAGLLTANVHHALVALVLMNVMLGAREPLARSWFNEEVTPQARATMLSFRNAVATAGGSLGLLVGGYVVDLRGIPFHWRMAGTLALLAVPCYLALRPRRAQLSSG